MDKAYDVIVVGARCAGSPTAMLLARKGYRVLVVDKLLVDSAAEAGAEIREAFTVEELLVENGRVVGIKGHSKNGGLVAERAAVVVGADGRHSLVAEAVRPEEYNVRPPLLAAY